MSEQSFEEMLDETFKTIHTGEVVDGTVIDVKEDQIILNIGYKADGIITRNEYSSTPGIDLTTVVSVGDTMQAKVLKVNDGEGQVLLTYRRLVADNGNKKLEEAYMFIRDISANGEEVLFVGTKKQAGDSIKEEALRANAHYVNARWLGGMMTNYKTIQQRIKRLEQLHTMEEDGTFDLLPKKEVVKLKLEIEKLEKFMGGIKNMKKLPGALFVVDPRKEKIAVAEAKKLGIPVVAIVDTNCDPDDVDYVIPANDDAIRAVKLIVAAMADAVCEAKGEPLTVAYVKDEDDKEVSMNDAVASVEESKQRGPRYKNQGRPRYNRNAEVSKPAEVKEPKTEA